MPIKKISFIVLSLFILTRLSTQSILISPDISIKNDFSYFVLAHPNGSFSLLRDKSFKISFQTLFPNFEWSIEKNIELPGKKWRLLDFFENQNDIDIFYVSKTDEEYNLNKITYNAQAEILNHRPLFEGVTVSINENLKIQNSTDKNWIAIGFNDLNNEKHLLLYNRPQDSVYYAISLAKIAKDDNISIHEVELSNEGIIYVFGRLNESTFSKKKNQTIVSKIDLLGIKFPNVILPFEDIYFMNGYAKIDDVTKYLSIGGLYSDKNNQTPKGYVICYLKPDYSLSEPAFVPFSTELLKEWNGNSKKSILSNSELNTRQIEFSKDSGCLIFYENTKELSRRPYFSSSDPTGAYASKWFDYYFDDIVIASFDKNGKLNWDRVLHKRQYSQDDEGLFSSFFIFRTNAILRILFNDAISSEGTVSEYLLKPNGDHIRKSILNTSYKNLNLRFKDAIELDAQSVLVPSENNGKLNLVKIIFD
ncbi:MAG: hypothetical protein WAS55_04935 [Saprospiraceae bacterium]|nr:hypothetical protein [Saprospiraceae bacterium]